MNDYLSKLKEDLFNVSDNLIKENIIDKSFNKLNFSLDYLSKTKQGEVSTNLFILLKNSLIDKKYDLTNDIKEKISKLKYLKKVEITKSGFINFFFNENYIIENLNQILLKSKTYGITTVNKNKKVNIEFVSANPTGPIHVAHIRGAVLGDVISSILEATGHLVTREYYVNDTGSQITILGNSLFKRYQQLFGQNVEISSDEYPGEYLISLAQIIADLDKDIWLKEIKQKRIKYFEQFAITEIINSIQKDLKSININFDCFTYESKIVEKKIINKVFLLLKNKDLLYEGILEKPKGIDIKNWEPRKQLLFRSSRISDDEDRPFKKANGEWTYFANDSAYHYDKYSRNYSHLINIWGADHIGYINRMKSIVEVITNQSNYLDIQICQIVRIIKNNKILKMSKREGNYVTLKEILNQIGKDSLRYFMISSKSETPMDLDIDKVIAKNKDNPVFYCQYAYARASSVINKSKLFKEFNNFHNMFSDFDYASLSEYEKEIILKLLSWPYLLDQASQLKQPNKITNYIEDLSSNFHSFWNRGKDEYNLRMLDKENKTKTITKLLWIESFRIVLKRAFSIIGIEARENM